nr:hypothetical protein [Brevundimonas naejangsanensis]
MGKALKTAGAIIGGAVLMATGVGALAGLQVTAMGIAGIGTMSVANLQLMSAGLMAAGSMLDKPKSTASGSPSDWTSNPDQGIPFLFGRMGVAGKIVHRDEYGQDNRLQGIVSVYSGAGPVKSFQGFTADELPVSFVSNGGTAVGKYNRQMWRSWRMGAQPDTALSLPTGLDGGAVMPMWGPLYKLSGKACDLLTLQQDSKFSVYPSGEPKPMQVLEGVYGYDPRYDDSYPGGAGPCRYGVRSTYRYIDNAIIAALNWALGMVENGQVVGGIGASLQGVDLPAFVEAANIADANAWTVAAWPDTSEDASVVLDELLEAGGAKRSRVAGKISCVSRGAPRPSIVTITRRDTAGAIELDTGASRFNRLNTITPVIMSEAHKWQHAPMNPVSFAPLVAEDGGKRSDQIKYRFVPKVKQGAELAAYDILDAREPFAGTIPLLPHLRRLKPGDCFDIDEPGFMLDGVKMLVLGRSYDPKAGEVRIAFRSETDSKHPLALGKTTTMPDYPGLTAPDPTEVSPPQPGDWTIIPRPPAPGGGQLPVIDLSGIVSNATADAMLINWREVAEGEDPDAQPPFMDEQGDLLPGWVDAGVWPPTTRTLSIQGPQPGAQIWIAIRYKRGNNVSPAELAGPITVGDLIAGDITPTAPTIVSIRSDIEAAFGDIFDVSELVGQARADLEAADASLYGNIVVLDNRAGVLETQTQSLETNKASVASLSAQIVRINDVEAVNAAQALALVDLENGKVSLSEYDTLKGEVASARDGSPSLLGKIQSLKAVDLDLQQNKASVQAVSALGVRTESLEADITGLQQVTADLEARKATSEALNAQRLRINDVEAVNAAQALALVDLENGKVALSEYSTLKGEVLAAREGAPSLLGQIQSLKSVDLDLQNNKASVASVDALAARTAHTEADIIGLENALANETTARAEAVGQLTARSTHKPNLIDNPSGAGAFRGWIKEGSPASYVDDDRLAGRIFVVYGYMVSQVYPASPGDQHSLGFVSSPLGDGGHVRLQYVTPGGFVDAAPVSSGAGGYDVRRRSTAPSTAPAGATGFRVVVVPPPGGVLPVWAIKVNFGSVAADFSDDYSATVLAATVTEQSLAIVDLENQQTIASWRIKSAASGSKPAIIEAVSALGGSYVAFGAEQIYFGDSTVFDDATDTMQTVVGGRVRVVAYGAPFGAANNLLEWWGPTGVALGAMNTTNGLQGRMTSLPYVFDNTINAPFVAVCNPPTSGRVVTTPGTYTSTVVTVEVTGGSGLYEYQWGYFAGSTGATATSPTGAATQINQTVASGETKSVVFLCMVRDTVTGRTTTATYRYTLTHSAA